MGKEHYSNNKSNTSFVLFLFYACIVYWKNERESVKLDLFYTDKSIEPFVVIEVIRLETLNEIIVMKLNAVNRQKKKDFWDLHELMDDYTAEEFISKMR